MMLAVIALALIVAAIVTLVTCVQVLYLESLRIRTREHASLEFFKTTLEAKLGLETERGSLTFSLIKHVGLAVLGCVTMAVALQGTGLGEALAGACLLVAFYTIIGTFIIPQIVYRSSSGRGLLALAPLLRALAWMVRPMVWALEFLQSLFELSRSSENAEATRPEEHIQALILAGEEEGIIEKGDRELIQSVVAFGDKTVREVMTPRPSIVAIRREATLEELRQLVIHEQFSRIPVYEETIDQIAGFVHVRDMFELSEEERSHKKVSEIMRPIRAVPETKAVNDLLREMQEEGAHMAVVVDEYGSTAGIVTMEDMVEEIVGEIHDEHEPDRDFRLDPDGSYVVSGSFDLGRLEDLLDFHPEERIESTTVGGLVTEWLGHVPEAGEETERDGIAIKVLAANHLRVDQVRVSKAANGKG
ncbi:MAG TPA: hemolysin family protein [Bryobacteraceae bacterium]|jgi:putative hemolysin|nr:hemolysin family protein [Bryobacteraceae bacterium]